VREKLEYLLRVKLEEKNESCIGNVK